MLKCGAHALVLIQLRDYLEVKNVSLSLSLFLCRHLFVIFPLRRKRKHIRFLFLPKDQSKYAMVQVICADHICGVVPFEMRRLQEITW